ncbi:hypothetical protein GN958_ATG02668 [Phytophthora infestans]|uniref:Uncharacterized protein n=1 Tax=Phytophthora infestans TaxID=4787 RepID=A0A8S9V4Q5_PHYIN|nr:hypothetical protein GN958_ATG02668 [Phytophthora infestans]
MVPPVSVVGIVPQFESVAITMDPYFKVFPISNVLKPFQSSSIKDPSSHTSPSTECQTRWASSCRYSRRDPLRVVTRLYNVRMVRTTVWQTSGSKTSRTWSAQLSTADPSARDSDAKHSTVESTWLMHEDLVRYEHGHEAGEPVDAVERVALQRLHVNRHQIHVLFKTDVYTVVRRLSRTL